MKDVEEKTTAILEEMGLREFEDQNAGTIPYGSQRSLHVQSKAAEMLGISRRVMHYKMKKYGMHS